MQRWLKDQILLEKATSQGSASDEVSLSSVIPGPGLSAANRVGLNCSGNISHPRDPDAGIEPRSPTLWADSLLSEPPPRKPIINIENDKYADIS